MNKKFILVAVVLGITVLTFSVAGPALAAGELGNGGGNGGAKGGYGGNGNQGTIGTGVPLELSTSVQGVLGDLIHVNLADSLGISVDELTLRLDAGETFSDIALSLGFDYTAINTLLVDARAAAVAQAIADGLITQETADWLASHGNDNPAASYGDGICDGTGDCLAKGTYPNTMAQKGFRKGAGK
jgi:hypothetical protein